MGIAASSVLRDESSSNGPAYGSLEGLGGPRTFKKKPVLVLDPEELASAHALFHEASAELLGEVVERAPRPASILGLAPMEDDDPEEMGHSDEPDADDESDLPSPEAVLSLTRRRSAPMLDDEGLVDDSGGLDDLSEAGFIDDGLDMSKRIFPSLPIQRGLADEGEIYDPVEPASRAEPAPVPTQVPVPAAKAPEQVAAKPFARAIVPPAPAPPPPVARSEAPPVDTEASKFTFKPAPRSAPQPAPQAAKPAPVTAESPPSPPSPPSQSAAPKPRPARFDELPPEKDYDTPDEVFDLDNWLAAPQDIAPTSPEPEKQPDTASTQRQTPELELSSEFEAPATTPDSSEAEDDSFTLTGDDSVDGYAFMRDGRPKRAVVTAAQEGKQSALRARLVREAEQEAALAKARAEEPAPSKSELVRMWNWLRGLFR